MKLTNIKVRYLLPGLVLLLLLLILPIRHFIINAGASGEVYQLRILEITDSGTTELANLKSGMSNVTIDTMTMKRFVSLRDDLDGRYDAVYIGKGSYNKSGVTSKSTDSVTIRAAAHDTTAVMNDITMLKAKELTDYFINKGLYVIFNKDPFVNQKSDQRGILYNTFNTYRIATPKENVLFVNDTELATMITSITKGEIKYLAGLKQRPRLQITNKSSIVDYSTDQNRIYNPGDTLSFNFIVSNVTNFQSHPINAKLYVSVDKSVKMTESQVVAVTTLTQGSTGEIKYKLPNTFSGLLYWKLEITDHLNSNKLKDFDSGTIRFRGKKTIVNILQILPNSGTERSSSLLDSNNMNQSYLRTDDYELNIQTKTITEFNSYVDAKHKANGTYGLNGVYDMLIFGFRDIYNNKAPISNIAAKAVVEFADVTKQSVMFTHDTVYTSSSNWVTFFKGITGQMDPETNLGLSAPNTSKLVKPVNDGLLTQYPFYLSTLDNNNEQKSLITPQVATTHNQYFTLDLEDSTIIPWYNIVGNKRDTNDSWNHYYTYSKGNVTYSGTGHIFGNSATEKFPDWEQKLFVNTMYRAFSGANHVPEIKVNSPVDKSVIPSYMSELLVDYNVQDWDLQDRNLKTTIQFKSAGKYLPNIGMQETTVQSGQNVHKSFANPLPDGGDLEIEIKAWDSHGAMASKTILITIVKATAKLEATRSLPANIQGGIVERDKKVTITYSVVPKPIAFADANAISDVSGKQAITNIIFSEQLPPNLEIDKSTTEVDISGNLQSGYSLTKKLSDITYSLQLVNGSKTFVPDPGQETTFRVTVTPNVTGTYNLGTSVLNFEDLHAIPGALLQDAAEYNLFLIDGDLSVSNLQVQGRIAASGTVDWRNINGGATINSLGNGVSPIKNAVVAGGDLHYNQNITIHGNAVYAGNFYKDATSNTGSIKGTVTKGTPIDFVTVRENLLKLSTTLGNMNQNRSAVPSDGTTNLIGNEGAKFYVFNISGDSIDKSHTININVPSGSTVLVNIDGTSVQMQLNTVLTGIDSSRVIYNFTKATNLTLRNTIQGTILAPLAQLNFDNGQITGQIVGRSIIRSSTLNFKPFNGDIPLPTSDLLPGSVQFSPATLTMHAIVKITNISLERTTILLNDDPMKLIASITPLDATNQQLTWTSSNPNIVRVNASTGEVTGIALDSATITATATDGSGISGSALVTVVGRTLRIEGLETAKPNVSVPLKAFYVTSNETGITYTWQVRDESGNLLPKLITSNQAEAVFTAPSSGKYNVSVVVNSNKVQGIEASKMITVSNPIQSLTITGQNSVIVGGILNLDILISPVGADITELVWSLNGNTNNLYATLVPIPGSSGYNLIANQLPTAGLGVIVTAPGVRISSAPHAVEITGLTGLQFNSNSKTINIGEQFNLTSLLWPIPRAVSMDQIRNNLTWSSSLPAIASFSSPITASNRGEITGNRSGSTIVTVTYLIPGRDPITAQIEVIVRPPTATDGDRY